MSDYALDIKLFLEKARALPVIDVRSPSEFIHSSVPGAINLPLFTNEERSVIGTLYLQKGSREAIMKGLDFIGPKMKEFAREGLAVAPGGEALMYCWRGGMRSNSMAWLFNTTGIKTSTLAGGYKSYRHYVLQYFSTPFRLVVIGGLTGSGKTRILEALESRGEQVIHLERLANHKGSVFGALEGLPQPSNEFFENCLFTEMQRLNPNKLIFVEDESLSIGQVFRPRAFYNQMSGACFIQVIVPWETRVEQLMNAYAKGDSGVLSECVKRIEKRLGLENAQLAIDCIRNGNIRQALEIVLKYYDRIYTRSMGLHNRKTNIEIKTKNENAEIIAEKIKALGGSCW